MKYLNKITSKLITTIFLIFSTTSVFAAGGTVTFTQGSPTGIPTLSGYMLILLSVLLFVVAVRTAKQKKSNINKLFITLIGTGVLVTAGSGVKLVSDVHAGGGILITFTNSNSVSYSIPPNSSDSYGNQTGQALNFTISADTTPPDPSVCRYRIVIIGQVTPTYSLPVETYSGTLPDNAILDVRCFDPTQPA